MVRHENRFYQVERQSQHHAPAKIKVRVCEWEDGRLEIHYRGQKLRWKQMEARPVTGRQDEGPRVREAPRATTKRKWRPGRDHPGRGGYRPGNLGSLPPARPAGALPLASTFGSPFTLLKRCANALNIVPCPQWSIGVFTFFHPKSR